LTPSGGAAQIRLGRRGTLRGGGEGNSRLRDRTDPAGPAGYAQGEGGDPSRGAALTRLGRRGTLGGGGGNSDRGAALTRLGRRGTLRGYGERGSAG
jgi:hypothetical protein